MRSMKLLKDWLLMLVSVSFMASAKSARSARCCQRSLSDFSSCQSSGEGIRSQSGPVTAAAYSPPFLSILEGSPLIWLLKA